MSEVMELGTSSIGAAWPPAPASSNRLKGFYIEEVIGTERGARRFVDLFREYKDEMERAGRDRLSIRAVASLGAVAILEQNGACLEGALPFERDGEALALVYTGWNASHRSLGDACYSAHRQRLGRTVERPQEKFSASDFFVRNGYEPHVVDPEMPLQDRAALAEKFTDVYAAFGYDYQETEAILASSANTIGYVEDAGQVVSTAMAEAGSVEVQGLGSVHLVEMTEAYTRPEYRGRGLYKAISGYVLETVLGEMREGQRAVDVLYGESNLAMPGVLNAAHENRRAFNHFDAERLGVSSQRFGILPQNVPVKDGVEARTNNDFALTYIPLNERARG